MQNHPSGRDIGCIFALGKVCGEPGAFRGRKLGDGVFVNIYFSSRAGQYSGDGFQQRAFAAAVIADNCGDFVSFRGKRNLMQNLVFSLTY